MSDDANPEPTMEEILSSIRKIIAEDEAEDESAEGVEPPPEPAPVSEPSPIPETAHQAQSQQILPPEPVHSILPDLDDEPLDLDDEILDLEEEYQEPESVTAPEPVPEPIPEPVRAPERDSVTPVGTGGFDSLLSNRPAMDTMSTFRHLVDNVHDRRGQPIGAGARTLEEMVKELLRPMLREWLDENLPQITERLVEREITKLVTRAEDDE